MNTKEHIDILNGIINNIGVKGFWFDSSFGSSDSISLCIPILCIHINRDDKTSMKYNYGFGYWKSIDEMFMYENKVDIRFILECIGKIRRNKNREKEYSLDYMSINDAGVNFLKCILDSGSLEEMKMKIQLRGYEI